MIPFLVHTYCVHFILNLIYLDAIRSRQSINTPETFCIICVHNANRTLAVCNRISAQLNITPIMSKRWRLEPPSLTHVEHLTPHTHTHTNIQVSVEINACNCGTCKCVEHVACNKMRLPNRIIDTWLADSIDGCVLQVDLCFMLQVVLYCRAQVQMRCTFRIKFSDPPASRHGPTINMEYL